MHPTMGIQQTCVMYVPNHSSKLYDATLSKIWNGGELRLFTKVEQSCDEDCMPALASRTLGALDRHPILNRVNKGQLFTFARVNTRTRRLYDHTCISSLPIQHCQQCVVVDTARQHGGSHYHLPLGQMSHIGKGNEAYSSTRFYRNLIRQVYICEINRS